MKSKLSTKTQVLSRQFRVIVTLFLASFWVTPQAKAFTFLTWEDAQYLRSPIKISYLSKSCRSIGISDNDMTFYIQSVIKNYWGQVQDTSLELVVGDFLERPFFKDGTFLLERMNINTIHIGCFDDVPEFKKSSDGSVTGGIGKVFCEKDGECRGYVLLNGDPEQISRVGRSYSRQFIGILAHEVGHALGIGHSQKLGALMTDGASGFVNFYGLKKDDHRAIQTLFSLKPSLSMKELLRSQLQTYSNPEDIFAETSSHAWMNSGFRKLSFSDPIEQSRQCQRFTNAILNRSEIFDFFGETDFYEKNKTIGMFFFHLCQEMSSRSKELQKELQVEAIDQESSPDSTVQRWIRDQILKKLFRS